MLIVSSRICIKKFSLFPYVKATHPPQLFEDPDCLWGLRLVPSESRTTVFHRSLSFHSPESFDSQTALLLSSCPSRVNPRDAVQYQTTKSVWGCCPSLFGSTSPSKKKECLSQKKLRCFIAVKYHKSKICSSHDIVTSKFDHEVSRSFVYMYCYYEPLWDDGRTGHDESFYEALCFVADCW